MIEKRCEKRCNAKDQSEFYNSLNSKLPANFINDIYVDKKKVAGILVQNVLSGKMIDHMVIGIGINVNQNEFDASQIHPFLENGFINPENQKFGSKK